MKNSRFSFSVLSTIFVIACLYLSVSGQTSGDKNKLAAMAALGSSVRWEVTAPHSSLTMTVLAPDGRVFRKEFKAGSAPEFMITDKQGERWPDGQYAYELRLTPVLSKGKLESLVTARGRDDEAEAVRATRKRAPLSDQSTVQSGNFSIVNGAIYVAGPAEEGSARPVSKVTRQPRLTGAPSAALAKIRQHHLSAMFMPDDVIPDDLIVQGSACIGLDCVNNETFGFDTIRLKENNTRVQFDDTSSAAGFATNNWQIRANSSDNGGASFLGFVDQGASGNSETGTVVFAVDAGAPANSLRVSSTGRLGLRTATPALDVHINTGDTPAIRFEQNSGSGFTAQTWDVAGNEANFFVRDVTGGSRLPFRVRPGAPTSSIDINASGSVGIGTSSPNKSGVTRALTVNGTTDAIYELAIADVRKSTMFHDGTVLSITNNANGAMTFGTNNAERMRVTAAGNVGIGTTTPAETLAVNGTASKPGGGSWSTPSDERLKNIKGQFNSGLKAVMQLQPLRYEYKPDNAMELKSNGEHVGFGAQAVQKVIPEAVTRNANGYLQIDNDPILWTMLNAIKEQQQEIAELKEQVRQLQTEARKQK